MLNVSHPAIGIQASKFVKIPKYPVLDKAKDLKQLKILVPLVIHFQVVRHVYLFNNVILMTKFKSVYFRKILISVL